MSRITQEHRSNGGSKGGGDNRGNFPCPSCGGRMVEEDYMCGECMRAEKPIAMPKIMLDEPRVTREDRASRGCEACPHTQECYARIRGDLWVLCEMPDELDLAVAQKRYGTADPMM